MHASLTHVLSPELVAKLGHDYTVYAFDYSEYETPLVGQGMLSWILASASTTPNAPAEQSQTMVTGRVCKNILGLFSNGIKETLEVKLKLVPVPTCKQSEYVENMERYHNLSKLLPEGLPDYNAWAQFLEANPAIRHLAQPPPPHPTMPMETSHMSGLESMRFDSFQDQHMSFNAYDTRASSPAMSTASFYQYPFHQDARPDSRASFHSDSAAYSQYFSLADTIQEQQEQQDQQDQQEQEEEGPPKKRARVTQAKRPRKSVLSANKDSLRVTASTAASVRLHKPTARHAGAAVSIEQVPRAPTPRPGNAAMPLARGPLRPVAPSLLRHTSVDGNRPYVSPYEPGLFSDAAQDSADDERGCSPGDTPMNMPSSPPVMRTASSSPDLPSLSFPNDSGFVSDMPGGREEEDMRTGDKVWRESDLPTKTHARSGAQKPNITHARSQWIQPVPETSQHANQSSINFDISTEEELLRPFQGHAKPPHSTYQREGPKETRRHSHSTQGSRPTNGLAPTDATTLNDDNMIPDHVGANAGSPGATFMQPAAHNAPVKPSGVVNNSTSFAKKPPPTKSRGLERSQTWSGEPMSDAACPADGKSRQPRSGSGAKRSHMIKNQLEQALVSGKMPQFCNHCGQIETPAWRKAYTRVECGSPEGIQLSSKGTNICALETMVPEEGGDGSQRYRIFKQSLTVDEMNSESFTTLTLCNPCGLWLGKRNAMRPQEVWVKAQAQATALANGEKPKRKRKPRKPKGENDDAMSDAVIPDSECAQPEMQDEAKGPSAVDGALDTEDTGTGIQPLPPKPSSSSRPTEDPQLDGTNAQAALFRAIQSSPAGLRGTKDSPIDVGEELTPKPTRRVLFPSPRRSGEIKSLGNVPSFQSMNGPDPNSKTSDGPVPLPGLNFEEVDKENCPPPADEDDNLSQFLNDIDSARTTPTKTKSLEDLLKTPTPASRRRLPLTPKRGGDVLGLTTPSRVLKTPRTAIRAATVAPETPFTRQLNALLSDCMASSPSQAIDFSTFPTFNTPGRTTSTGAHFGDLLSNDFLSSDLPIPSSPTDGLNFSVFEDPNTSTVGLWSGASIFEVSNMGMGDHHVTETESRRASVDAAQFKMHDMSMDFSALLEGVVGNMDQADNTTAQTVTVSVEETDHELIEAADSHVPTSEKHQILTVATKTSETVINTTSKEADGLEHCAGKKRLSPCGIETVAGKGKETIGAPTPSLEMTKAPIAEETTSKVIDSQSQGYAVMGPQLANVKETVDILSPITNSKGQTDSPATVNDIADTPETSKSPPAPVQATRERASTPEVRIKSELVAYDDST